MHRLVLILEHDTWVPSGSGHGSDGGRSWGVGLVGRANYGQAFLLISFHDLRV